MMFQGSVHSGWQWLGMTNACYYHVLYLRDHYYILVYCLESIPIYCTLVLSLCRDCSRIVFQSLILLYERLRIEGERSSSD